ncbi:uncharacterized protein PAC_09209 [Phialocephala subalpina]|uniref:Methyltransferase domain-containing protein n=1 Tax=Phialocephala subalpina TaxID=576137 RepID=A0A1L7X2V1_9HELO|nr:uncharacterized protein PAC_09209 [Phialocephala subalpina]
MPLLFTSLEGEILEIQPEDLPPTSSLHPANAGATTSTKLLPQPGTFDLPIRTLDGSNSPASQRSHCGSPLIEFVTPDKLPLKSSPPRRSRYPGPYHRRTGSLGHRSTGVKAPMVYNEYGELVPEATVNQSPTPGQLSVTQLLRVIKKAYHHDLRDRLSRLVNPHPDGGHSALVEDKFWSHRLSSWDLRLRTPKSVTPRSSVANYNPPVYRGQRRVLEIGAGDGNWCFSFKKQQSDWVVDGVDNTDHWSCFERGVPLRDFMKKSEPTSTGMPSDYFTGATPAQSFPEFTMRDINRLLMHENPIPCNFYEYIRGREIFDRIESYKMFLEDVRCLLKLDGVVEFIEIDPRPRIAYVVKKDEEREVLATGKKGKMKSTAPTDWTDKIEDRFKDPLDQELATDVPGWSGRVAQRLKANLRPRDGVPAANLKSWIEGAGFWDVKQFILPIPVGGSTRSGRLLKEYILYQLELENSIPKLLQELSKFEADALETGAYHLNIHIVTGRKPMDLRTGDLMPSGERREMTNSTYDAKIMQNLNTLPGAPEQSTVTRGTAEDGLKPLLCGLSELSSPFNAPPFVTLKEMEDSRGAEKDRRSQLPRTGLPRLG